MKTGTSVTVSPTGSMNILSEQEVARLHNTNHTGLYKTFRQCALAVLHCNTSDDNAKHLMAANTHFDIHLHQEPRGLKLELINTPNDALVDGKLIEGVRENLFSVLRDILYANNEFSKKGNSTNLIFEILRNSGVFIPSKDPNIIVCWGGHSINRVEYEYCKGVGYQLGLRKMDICTGCGPGAMKGPMKGAHLGHAKQRVTSSRLIGLSEPGIIAAETPNAIVNQLVIMPDIEKRLEAFVRLGHGFIVFPGGVGTVEEILYLLGILASTHNKNIPFPLIFTGPAESEDYFNQIDQFIGNTLGKQVQSRYEIIINNPKAVAKQMNKALQTVKDYRKETRDAYHFNWNLSIDRRFQTPFKPTHSNMANLELCPRLPTDQLAANLRCAMSGIVSGNIKQDGLEAIEQYGPYQLQGDPALMQQIDNLLTNFIKESRMKLPSKEGYTPCYTIKRVT